MRIRSRTAVHGATAAAALAGVLVIASLNSADFTASVADTTTTTHLYELDVPARTSAAHDAELLENQGFDVLHGGSTTSVKVLASDNERSRLTHLGFKPKVARALPEVTWKTPTASGDTYYGGYPTISGQYTHMRQVAHKNPRLAKVINYGRLWRKLNGVANGYDLKAICITAITSKKDCSLSPKAPKKRFLLMGQLHAREIATGDIAYRWIDELVDNYGSDKTVTKLMKNTEFWVIPVANPDGVDIVQSGGDAPQLQRKNADSSHEATACPTPPTDEGQSGVDLNRNNGVAWNSGGSSSDPCSPAYMGPSADSEPETVAIHNLLRKLYPDTRGPELTDVASPDSRGMFIGLHSDVRTVLFPWAYTKDLAPNDAALRAVAKHLADDTGYRYGKVSELMYAASGGLDDWSYGELGIPSFTIEVGSMTNTTCNGFLPVHSCMDTDYWPNLRTALLHAAELADAPYTVN
ncbi:M14 family zinc carboxypeptidase [Streptomyces sp. NPDC005322]|uniref:M14 family zinc carboxypeptidase n=1 Tax=Streptomyces sp. NPDC005322 TaxID=3157032 RepID=UPI0033A67CBD